MDPKSIYEIIGYAGFVLLAVSFLLSSVIWARIITLVGALCFVAYGLLVGAYPVVLLNLILAGLSLYRLYQIYSTKNYFAILEVQHDSKYLMAFLDFHAEEIKRCLPDFTYLPSEQSLTFFIVRDMVPVGLFIAEGRGGGALWMQLDFVVPTYRELNVGRFLYEQKADFFKDKDIRKIYSASGTAAHTRALRQMGFLPDSSDTTGALYSRALN